MAKDSREIWKQQIGSRLVKELKRVGIKQSELAAKLNYTKQLINHWCIGRSEITAWDLMRLGKMGINVSFLLFGGTPSNPEFGVDTSGVKRVSALEDENRELKKLLAEQMLENARLTGIVRKK
jgi:transcriptional regulator with XRE-family HTH domain